MNKDKKPGKTKTRISVTMTRPYLEVLDSLVEDNPLVVRWLSV